MGKFDKHIAKPGVFKIGDDEFRIEPLPFEQLGDVYDVFLVFMDDNLMKPDISDEELGQEVLKKLDVNRINKLRDLALITLKQGYPDEDEGVLKKFVSANLLPLMMELIKVNMPQMEGVDVDRYKEQIKQAKSART